MVEFTLMLPLLLLLLIGIAELGRAVLAFTLVNHATREAADYAALTMVLEGDAVGYPALPTRREAWQYPCNLGDITSPTIYNANDPQCQGWPNVVATAVKRGQGLDANRMTVAILYESPDAINPQAYSRGIPIHVTVTYDHTVLFAHFLRLPATIRMTGTSEKISQ